MIGVVHTSTKNILATTKWPDFVIFCLLYTITSKKRKWGFIIPLCLRGKEEEVRIQNYTLFTCMWMHLGCVDAADMRYIKLRYALTWYPRGAPHGSCPIPRGARQHRVAQSLWYKWPTHHKKSRIKIALASAGNHLLKSSCKSWKSKKNIWPKQSRRCLYPQNDFNETAGSFRNWPAFAVPSAASDKAKPSAGAQRILLITKTG